MLRSNMPWPDARTIITLWALLACSAGAQARPRSADLGIPIGGTAGPLDAITDVAGVEVGFTTLVSGRGRLVVGEGPVRTGVTVIHPRGKSNPDPVFGAWFTLNGNGEMTGTTWLQEGGFLEGPVGITNTHSVGVVRDAIIDWQIRHKALPPGGSLPIVAETYDGGLNDIDGLHVKPAHVFAALDGAKSGPVFEGNVGGGTGMVCHGFKGGTGTSSRTASGYTVGVLVQCNCCSRRDLSIAGVPVGLEITDLLACTASNDSLPARGNARRCSDTSLPPGDAELDKADGSIIIVIATDAPLLPSQLKRIATRASLGVGRMGGRGENGSGDIFLAFSTANPHAAYGRDTTRIVMLSNERASTLFAATVQATEEAMVNAMLGAETMTGANDRRVYALPVDRLRTVMAKYGRPLKP